MSTWTLIDDTQTEQTLAAWGLSGLQRTLRNQAADTVRFTAPGRATDADPLFAHGSTVVIKRNGLRWFEGRVVRTPVHGSPEREDQRYELAGPWWYLDDLVYQQGWKQLSDFGDPLSPLTEVDRSRLLLGMNADGNKIHTGLQITAAINYAILAGRPLQLGTIDPAADAPWDELQDATCAEVIRKMLRWTPDTITWFDYTTSPPTLHVRRLSHLTSQSLSLSGGEGEITQLRLAPRPDLQRSAVILKYERDDTVDGTDYAKIVTDAYPPAADPLDVGVLTMTLELGGGRRTFQKQPVTVDPIVEDGINWWKGKLPWLRDVTNLTISQGLATPDTLPNELIQGNISSWMEEDAGTVEVTAEASYEVLADSSQAFHATLNPVIEKRSRVKLSTRVRGTTASTRTYARLRSFTPAEPIPVGLAQAIYESLSPLQYEGRLVLQQEEAGATAWLGRKLQLSGGRSEWSGMNAPIQSVIERIDDGQTELHFGPVTPLGADDLIELIRANRGRRPTFRLAERSEGSPGGGSEQEGPDATANDSPDLSGGTPEQLTVFQLSGDGRIVLDTADCDDRELRVRELDVCDNGVAKKIRVIASAPYTP